ncbi:hypothetical protein DFJ73DRAFT_756848 [Zopfochytrium polystomum]|nr:hypothetical protein DFJ73DRAFT_756848 [Zopfochytrium polystomum]
MPAAATTGAFLATASPTTTTDSSTTSSTSSRKRIQRTTTAASTTYHHTLRRFPMRRRSAPDSFAAVAGAAVIALLVAMIVGIGPRHWPASALAAGSPSGPSSPRAATDEVIGGMKFKVGGVMGQGGNSKVSDAVDSNGNAVVIKEMRTGENFSDRAVAATKAGNNHHPVFSSEGIPTGQYVSHEGSKMAQKKVGTHDIDKYLEEKKANPSGWTPNSAQIVRQIHQQQRKAGYLNADVSKGNIRVDANKRTGLFGTGPPEVRLIDWDDSSAIKNLSPSRIKSEMEYQKKTIERLCHAAGFKFRSAGGNLYRRGVARGTCAGGKAGKAEKGAAGGAGGTRAAAAGKASAEPAQSGGSLRGAQAGKGSQSHARSGRAVAKKAR